MKKTVLLTYLLLCSLQFVFAQAGRLDTSFGLNGIVAAPAEVFQFTSVVVQEGGKIVVAGRAWNGSNYDFVVARYNINGSPDSTFSSDGMQTTDFASQEDYANAVCLQSDGKIVVAGYSGNADSSKFSVARYNADGSADNTFNGDGKIQTDFGSNVNEANSVAVQSDGKIVVVGKASYADYGYSNFAVARYNIDGSPDNSFSGDGKQTVVLSRNGDEQDSYATSVVIQGDGKIVVAGISDNYNFYLCAVRINSDGTTDNTYGNNGQVYFHTDGLSCSADMQSDGKIVVGGYFYYRGDAGISIARYNTNGSRDVSFGGDGTIETESSSRTSALALQDDNKIIMAGSKIFRYNTDGSLDSSFGDGNGQQTAAFFANGIAIDGNKLYTAGGALARYLLDAGESSTPPKVSITTPADSATYIEGNYIKVSITATDSDGTITKVEFYNDSTLLHTQSVAPYGYQLKHLPAGNYTITAKAYDNSGNVTTSAPVHITVVENQVPIVSITTPINNATYTIGDYIKVNAAATDADGKITKVEFYRDSALLHTETVVPYGYQLKHLPAGTYTITVKAYDNLGLSATSAPVTITLLDVAAIVSSKPYSQNEKTALKDALSLRAFPNPATQIVNLRIGGLQLNKPASISLISNTGIVLKNINISTAAQTTQLNVSSLAKGVYTIKIVSGDKILYKQFVKL